MSKSNGDLARTVLSYDVMPERAQEVAAEVAAVLESLGVVDNVKITHAEPPETPLAESLGADYNPHYVDWKSNPDTGETLAVVGVMGFSRYHRQVGASEQVIGNLNKLMQACRHQTHSRGVPVNLKPYVFWQDQAGEELMGFRASSLPTLSDKLLSGTLEVPGIGDETIKFLRQFCQNALLDKPRSNAP